MEDLGIEAKVRHLINLYKDEQKLNADLRQRLRTTEEALREVEERLADCDKQLNDLRYAKATKVSEAEARTMRNRMLKLEREVEKCISLLNS